MNNCDQCGFHYADVTRTSLRRILFAGVDEIQAVLTGSAWELLRQRPAVSTWSPLEYACHVRDVLDVQTTRVVATVTEDEPEVIPMDRDARVINERYNAQNPLVVAHELLRSANRFASTTLALTNRQWERRCWYNWPTRAPRTVAWLCQHTAHEVHHHLQDIRNGIVASGDMAGSGDRLP